MPVIEVKIVNNSSNALPEYATNGSSGMDIRADLDAPLILQPLERKLIPTGLFIQALNVMIDDQEKRLAALRSRIPNSVLLALFGIAAVAGAFAGYASGLEEKRSRVPVYLMGLVVSAVIFIILDLDRPSAGFITNNQQPMIDTAATIAAFPELK